MMRFMGEPVTEDEIEVMADDKNYEASAPKILFVDFKP